MAGAVQPPLSESIKLGGFCAPSLRLSQIARQSISRSISATVRTYSCSTPTARSADDRNRKKNVGELANNTSLPTAYPRWPSRTSLRDVDILHARAGRLPQLRVLAVRCNQPAIRAQPPVGNCLHDHRLDRTPWSKAAAANDSCIAKCNPIGCAWHARGKRSRSCLGFRQGSADRVGDRRSPDPIHPLPR
ncbi:hypothetical protein ACVIHI_000325 [Bradyrhizobium sp. USDA 4524]